MQVFKQVASCATSQMNLLLLSSFVILCLYLPGRVLAEDYSLGYQISDGKNGRLFKQWTQPIKESPVQSVSITLRKDSGGNDTFVNLRFGRGDTFENGRRVFLTHTGTQTVSWNVGQAPNGEPLVLNAYNGEVYVESARVQYVRTESERQPPRNPFDKPYDHRPGNNNQDDYPRRPHDDSGHYQGDNNGDVYPPGPGSRDNRGMIGRCRRANISRPRVEIDEIRPTGGLFSGKYKVEGTVLGVCVVEAGYYENGRLKEKIDIPLNDVFSRGSFELRVRSGQNGKIRVFTTDGQEDTAVIDDEVSNQGSPLF